MVEGQVDSREATGTYQHAVVETEAFDRGWVGRFTRFVNVTIDSIVLIVLNTVAYVAIAAVIGWEAIGGSVFEWLLSAAISLTYYIGMEGAFGRTIGKLFTGTEVVTWGGRKPRLSQIIGRTLVRFIPFEPFSFFFMEGGVGWHDTLSGTVVVKVRRVRSH